MTMLWASQDEIRERDGVPRATYEMPRLLGMLNLVSAALNRLKFSLASDVACRQYELDGILNRALADPWKVMQ